MVSAQQFGEAAAGRSDDDAVLRSQHVAGVEVPQQLVAPVVKRELNSFLAFVKRRDAGLETDEDTDQEPVKTTV
ncbi:hypothetical protein ACGFZH_00320 [Streptomyces zaomyceticus]|uniref:hypothetical protein n=1 Tax=Streptomyces zaomyceticus TaxID=68286 RepID=UPI0037146384